MSREKVRALYFALKWLLLGMLVPTAALDLMVLFVRTKEASAMVTAFVLVPNVAMVLALILRGSMSSYFNMKAGERTAYNIVDLLAVLSREVVLSGGFAVILYMTDGFHGTFIWPAMLYFVVGIAIVELIEHVIPLVLWKRLDRSWGFPEDPLFLQSDSNQVERVLST